MADWDSWLLFYGLMPTASSAAADALGAPFLTGTSRLALENGDFHGALCEGAAALFAGMPLVDIAGA
jgi:hypothetical protein